MLSKIVIFKKDSYYISHIRMKREEKVEIKEKEKGDRRGVN